MDEEKSQSDDIHEDPVENDEISVEEEGFMQGYEQASERTARKKKKTKSVERLEDDIDRLEAFS